MSKRRLIRWSRSVTGSPSNTPPRPTINGCSIQLNGVRIPDGFMDTVAPVSSDTIPRTESLVKPELLPS